VPVKVRVNAPGPVPLPVCWELLAMLGESRCAQVSQSHGIVDGSEGVAMVPAC